MKIAVLNGSPKGDVSVTMQYIHFMNKYYSSHEIQIHNISQQIKKIEKDKKAFRDVISSIRSCDLVLWAFPLYVCLVPSQYKRFIELITERKSEKAFRGKFTGVLTTSIHFFDNIAHEYMRAICDDLGMVFAGSYSAHMYDLMGSTKRNNFMIFAESVFKAVEEKQPSAVIYPAVRPSRTVYRPGKSAAGIDAGDKKILILTDLRPGEKNLAGMISRLSSSFKTPPEIINLNDIDIKGGCIGCIQCGFDNSCSYGDSDGYHDFYESKVKPADIIFMAGSVHDRFLSYKWKEFFDRAFYNTHIPVLAGKQMGMLISGPLAQIPMLREFIAAVTDWQMMNSAGVVSDDSGDSRQIDAQIKKIAADSVWFAERKYIKPQTFLGVGSWKIFRDDIFGRLRFPFISDYKYYREHNLFDFPQKMFKFRMTNAVLIFLTKFTGFRNEIYKRRMRKEIVKPLTNIVKYK
jgi:multimeric flavodoxin WrbA